MVSTAGAKNHTRAARLGLHCGYELPTTPLVTDVHATHLGEVARQGGVLVKGRHQHRHPRKAPPNLRWLGVLLQGREVRHARRASACQREAVRGRGLGREGEAEVNFVFNNNSVSPRQDVVA